jgi:hypothetical protein
MMLLSVFPRLTGLEGTDSARQIRRSGAIHLGYSALTDYPLGVVKVLPFKAHLALDAAGAVVLAATPFLTGQWKKGTHHWLPHVALAAFEMSSLALTDPTGEGDFHGNIEAVRSVNTEDPHRKIHTGPPAVKPATATATA